MESLIDFPIPYWNGFATDAADPESPYAGIPQIFLDDEYVHPDGSTRKNPLKFALAYQGRSKNGTSQYVQRNPILVNGRRSENMSDWNREIALLTKYHDQIAKSMQVDKFSELEGVGVPWAAIPAFGEDMPDHWYQSQQSFDGWFEQAHDNFHGWLGGPTGDMVKYTWVSKVARMLIYARLTIHTPLLILCSSAITPTWIVCLRFMCKVTQTSKSLQIFRFDHSAREE